MGAQPGWLSRFRRLLGPPAAPLPPGLVLDPDDRVLASAVLAAGHVVATERVLWLTLGEEPVQWPWHTLAAATWNEEDEMTVTPMAGDPLRLTLPEPGLVPEVVRERVTRSIVVSAHTALLGNAGVRILGRRRHGSDEVLWQLRFDAGVDAEDPEVRRRAESALDEVRANTGI